MKNLVLNKYRDGNISINKELHEYSLRDDSAINFTSVTTLIGEYFEPFDGLRIANKLVSTHPRYSNTTVEELLGSWKEAQNHGNEVHSQIEEHILNNQELTERKAQEGVNWLNQYTRVMYNNEFTIGSENIIYSKKYKIAGSIDVVIKCSKTNKISLIDWKTNKSISTNSFNGKVGTHPITQSLEDCKYIKYALQLNMYARILEMSYGYEIDNLIIVHLTNNNTVESFAVPKKSMNKYIDNILDDRKDKICLI